MKLWIFGMVFPFLILLSCNQSYDTSSNASTMFQKLNPKQTGITFNNQITEDTDFHHLNWESVYNGGGVATADFNNDGLLDLYFTGNQVDDALYINQGDFVFEDVSKKAGITSIPGWSTGVSVADVNNDGWLDIYVCRMWHTKDSEGQEMRRNLLYINQGDLTFKEEAVEYGLADTGHGTQASFFDFDADGDLDMYLLNAPSNNYSQKIEYINANAIPYEYSDKLFRNDGNQFTDITKEAGIEDYGFGLGIVTVDINQDGLTDVYVANDFEIADRMFINQGDGTFKDEIQTYLKHISYSSMGTDIADINNDGLEDIAVLDMQSSDHFRSKTNMPSMNPELFWTNVVRGQHYQYMTNMLQLNNGDSFFSEIGSLAGMSSSDWSWSVLLADFDQDQFRDMFISNGLNKDIRNNDYAEKLKKQSINNPQELFDFSQQVPSQPIANIIYQNIPNSLHFERKNDEWGGCDEGFSFGAAYADLDNDGDLDLVVNNNNQTAGIFKNTHNGNYLTIKTRKGKSLLYNCKAEIFYHGKIQFAEASPIRGYQSSVSPMIHFGLDGVDQIDSIHVDFPTGERHVLYNVLVNQILDLDYTQITLRSKSPETTNNATYFTDFTGASGMNHRHQDNRFNDFEKESLLPHMQSKNSPYLAHADFNNDGNDDVFIGSSHGSEAALYVTNGGNFELSSQSVFEEDQKYEDQGAVFTDVDQDGDLDLYVVSGGSEYPLDDPIYQDRLYINTNGQFIKSDSWLPKNTMNGSCVIAADFNGNGKPDLFVGGRGIPGRYPYPAMSQLLINMGDHYADKTIELAPELRKIGMITDAIWDDFDGDNLIDLLVIGEFMQPHFFINNGRQLMDKTEEFLPENMNGWWYAVTVADIRGDGKKEILLGNIGMNNKYHPNPTHPLKVYGNDFDKNNTPDIVLSKVSDAYGEVPVRGRECSSEQMPFIKNKFKDYQTYASAGIVDIYGDKSLEESIQLYADNFYSGFLEFKNGKYEFVRFPDLAQISAVKGIETYDFDQDGDLDIILIGNMYDAEVETVRHDASIGLVLENIDGNFVPLDVKTSGWYTPGNARNIVKLKNEGETFFAVSNNGFVVQVIKANEKENL